jgi:hypothetical protein
MSENGKDRMREVCHLCVKGFPVNASGEHYGTQSLGMISNTPCVTEYLRRNMLVCKAVGARSYIPGALARLQKQKRPPQWILRMLAEMDKRLEPLPTALAAYRDEVQPPQLRALSETRAE